MSPFNLDDYEPVEDRLRTFWEEHPEGRVLTDLVHTGVDGYIVKASVWREHAWAPPPDATGLAQEAVTERGVNSTSALENCETSAIGRALANMGYAAKGKRPSREEMVKASGGSSSGESITPPASSSQRQQGTPPEETSEKTSAYGEGAAAPSAPMDPGGQAADSVSSPQGTVDPTIDRGDVNLDPLATADDLANAAKHGLTPTKTKAIAASLGITVTKATELTREQLAAVINRYLEVKK